MAEEGHVTRGELARVERGLSERMRARDGVMDAALRDLKEQLAHKANNVRQEFSGRLELAEILVRDLTTGDDSVPVLRARIRTLERAREDDERRIDELRMSAARFAGIVAAAAPAAGAIAWAMDRLFSR